jgi:hypothetical protein
MTSPYRLCYVIAARQQLGKHSRDNEIHTQQHENCWTRRPCSIKGKQEISSSQNF